MAGAEEPVASGSTSTAFFATFPFAGPFAGTFAVLGVAVFALLIFSRVNVPRSPHRRRLPHRYGLNVI
jgi:hypothetical protein